jgi:cation:H+ antiporter
MAAAPLVPIAVGFLALVALVVASGVVVERLLALATHFEVPDALVGLFVLSIGTSLPEIGTHVIASTGILAGRLDYAVTSATVIGGNMGSSTTQQLLLVALFLVSVGHVTVASDFARNGVLPMIGALVLTLAVAADGTLGRLDGAVLLLAFAAYAVYSFARRERSQALPESESAGALVDSVVAAGGLLVVLVAAFVVLSTVELVVTRLAFGGSMLGLVTIGIASALPELSTVLESIRRQTPNLALGTLVGSNVVNPLVGIGLGSAISTYAVPDALLLWDLPFKIVAGVGFLAVLYWGPNNELDRRTGAALLILYFVYLVGRLVLFPGE